MNRRGGENRGGCMLSVCGERNVWNPNCVIAPEQTLVLPVIPQTAGSVCVCECVCVCVCVCVSAEIIQ